MQFRWEESNRRCDAEDEGETDKMDMCDDGAKKAC